MSTGSISSTARGVVCAVIAGLVLAMPNSPAIAAPAAKSSTAVASDGATDFSAARRHRHYYRGSNAAGAAFAGLAFGVIAGAIATQQRRDYYENYGYYDGPGYYNGPAYQPYYGPRYYYRRY